MTVHESFHRLAKLYDGITAEQLQEWYGYAYGGSFNYEDYDVTRHEIRTYDETKWLSVDELRAEIAAAEKPTWQQQVIDALEWDDLLAVEYTISEVCVARKQNNMEWWIYDNGIAIGVLPGYQDVNLLVNYHDRLVDRLNKAGLDQYKRIIPKHMPTVEGDSIRFVDTDNYVIYRHYKTGEYHRLDGPSYSGTDGYKSWDINGTSFAIQDDLTTPEPDLTDWHTAANKYKKENNL